MGSDVNKVDAINGLPNEMYSNMKCVELWNTEIEYL